MEKSDELISVIIPVYNVEAYLERCIESIRAQSYLNLDIILVDDGSTDKCGEICDAFAKEDNRIQVFHKKNGGLSDARNFGICHAKGEYIVFLDSDDFVLKDYIGHLYLLIKHFGSDIAVSCAKKVYSIENNPNNEEFYLEKSLVFSSEEALEDMLYRENIPIYAVAKMYKRFLFLDVQFPKGELFEDISTTYRLFHCARSVVFNPISDYYYVQRQASIVNSGYSSAKMVQIYNTEKIVEFAKQYYPNIIDAAKSKCFITALNYYRTIPAGKIFTKDRQYTKEVIKKYRAAVFADKRNKKLIRALAFFSFFSLEPLRLCGKAYQYLLEKEIIKARKPI